MANSLSPSSPYARYTVATETQQFLKAALIEGSKMIEAYLPEGSPPGDYDYIPKAIKPEI